MEIQGKIPKEKVEQKNVEVKKHRFVKHINLRGDINQNANRNIIKKTTKRFYKARS